MNLKSIITLTFLALAFTLNAQVADDILRYSRLEAIGTARTAGVAGSLSALGSDFSTISVNPGSLGNYRKSEFTLTPGVNITTVKGTVEDGVDPTMSSTSAKFGFRHVGFVFHKKPRNTKWTTYNVAIGFNQLANFHNKFEYSGRTPGSIADRWLQLAYANGSPLGVDELDDFEAGLAFDTGAIFPDGADYFNDFEANPIVPKRQRVTNKGSVNELLIALAANYGNKLSIGGSLSIPIINYSYKKIYEEEDDGVSKDGDIEFFNSLKFTEDLTTSGVGVNVKLGATYRLSQAFRLGIAFHTPTSIRLTDSYYNKTNYDFTGANGLDDSQESESPDGTFDYGLKTPLRLIGSAAYIIGKRGFLSGEVEYLDYGAANFNFTRNSSDDGDVSYEREVNEEIGLKFGAGVNIRLGGELVLADWRVRAGIGLIGDPNIAESRFDNHYSAGLGYRSGSFYFDLAYRLFSSKQGYSPYNLVDDAQEPNVTLEGLNNQILTTVGFRF